MKAGPRDGSYEWVELCTDQQRRKPGGTTYLFARSRTTKARLQGFGVATPENLCRAHLFCGAYDAAVLAAKALKGANPTDAQPVFTSFGQVLTMEGVRNALADAGWPEETWDSSKQMGVQIP